jgi:hypothetical protein
MPNKPVPLLTHEPFGVCTERPYSAFTYGVNVLSRPPLLLVYQLRGRGSFLHYDEFLPQLSCPSLGECLSFGVSCALMVDKQYVIGISNYI